MGISVVRRGSGPTLLQSSLEGRPVRDMKSHTRSRSVDVTQSVAFAGTESFRVHPDYIVVKSIPVKGVRNDGSEGTENHFKCRS